MQQRVTLDRWIADAQRFEFGGQRIAYWTAGTGAPLLLVHGFPTSSWDWHRVWHALSERRRLVACDMAGFGLSGKPRGGYSIHRQADLQEALLEHVGATRFDALVHDYGDTVGQELLARRIDGSGAAGLRGMIFLNGGLFPELHRPRPLQRLGASPLGFVVSLLMNRRRFGRAFAAVFGPDTQPSAEELDEHWRLIAHDDGHRITHRLLHYMGDRRRHRDRWVGALERADVPLKLIDGGADPVSGRHLYEYFRQRVPQAGAVCLDDIGHYPQLEAPGRVVDEVVAFLEQR